MLPKIHILATCRKPELIRATTLIFDTLRVGFPNSHVHVWLNALQFPEYKTISDAAHEAGCHLHTITEQTIHHEWIQTLLDTETEPFIILDTDMVFWSNCEGFDYKDYPLCGRLIPKFFDPFTKCITRSRLHGSFLYFNPEKIQERFLAYKSQFPETPFNPVANLIYPLVVPDVGQSVFYDTCCLLYKAVGGASFTDEQLECYDHLHAGTISDIVAPHLTDIRMRESHFAIFENPKLAKGSWKQQNEWYAKHRN